MSHLVFLWQGVFTFVTGFLVGTSLVCIGGWLLVAWFTIGGGGKGDWTRLRSRSVTHEAVCPIILEDLPRNPRSSPSTPQEETCHWLNALVNYFLFPSAPMNGLQRRIRTGLLGKLLGIRREASGLISCLTVEEVRGNRHPPVIKKITIFGREAGQAGTGGEEQAEELHLALDISFKGEALVLASGLLGFGLGRIVANLKIRPSSGRLLLKFVRFPSPRVSLMLSDLPNFTLAIDRGESSLSRIANLSSLILSSVLRNHAVFPHFQSFLFKPEAETFKASIMTPFWRSSRRFLWIQVQSIVLSEEVAAASRGAIIAVSVSIGGTNKCKSGPLSVDQQSPIIQFPRLILQHALPLTASPSRDSILVTVTRRGGPAGNNSRFASQKKAIIFTALLPLDCIPSDVPHTMGIFPESGQATGCRVNLELLLCTESMSISQNPAREWPLSRGLQLRPGEDVKYLDGMDWSNFKRAWRRFRRTSDAHEREALDEHEAGPIGVLHQQLEELIQSLADTSKILPVPEQVLLRNSLSSLSSEFSALAPSALEMEHFEGTLKEPKNIQGLRSRSHEEGEDDDTNTVHEETTPTMDPPFNAIDDSFELLAKLGEETISVPYEHGGAKYHLYSTLRNLTVSISGIGTFPSPSKTLRIPVTLVNETMNLPCDILIDTEEEILCFLADGKNILLVRAIDCISDFFIVESSPSAMGRLTVTVNCTSPSRSTTFMLSLSNMMLLASYFNSLSANTEWSIDPKNDVARSSSLVTFKNDQTLDGLLYLEPDEISKGALLIPFVGILKHELDLIFTRTAPAALTPRLVNPQHTSRRRESFSGEVFEAFELYLPPEQVNYIAKGFLKRSLPLPGQLFLTSLGILFASRISEKRLLLPKDAIQSCELYTRWHTKLLVVTILRGDSQGVEFMQITDSFITALHQWCSLHGIPLNREAAK